MLSPKLAVFILLLASQDADSWFRRRRRRQCSPRACEVSSWSSWSSCSTSECGQQQRSRTVESSASCGGTECPTLDETRQCYGSRSLDCKISSWSEWSACTTPCGISGIQSSARHRIVIEKCGGTCTSTFRKTRKCPLLSCLNGGTMEDETCFCTDNYGGNCCEKKKTNVKVAVGCTVGALFVVGVIVFLIKHYYCGSSRVHP